jgi:hypothetical protein
LNAGSKFYFTVPADHTKILTTAAVEPAN